MLRVNANRYPWVMDLFESRRLAVQRLIDGPRFGGSQAAFSLAADIPPSYVTRMLKPAGTKDSKKIGDEMALKIEDKLGLPRGEMLQPALVANEKSSPYGRGGLRAQTLSQAEPMIIPQPIAWEELMGELPPTFTLEMQDDSMADELRKGARVIFSIAETARAQDIVLIADGSNNHYVREYRERTPGHWKAVALNGGYEPLDSITDNLRVRAVMIGQLGRRSGAT